MKNRLLHCFHRPTGWVSRLPLFRLPSKALWQFKWWGTNAYTGEEGGVDLDGLASAGLGFGLSGGSRPPTVPAAPLGCTPRRLPGQTAQPATWRCGDPSLVKRLNLPQRTAHVIASHFIAIRSCLKISPKNSCRRTCKDQHSGRISTLIIFTNSPPPFLLLLTQYSARCISFPVLTV